MAFWPHIWFRRARTPSPFNGPGRAWLARQALPDDERAAITRHLGELDRLCEDLAVLDREIAEATVDDPAVRRLLTIAGVNLTVAAGLVAAIGDLRRFPRPQQLARRRGVHPLADRADRRLRPLRPTAAIATSADHQRGRSWSGMTSSA